jgi:lysophospholipase L1-like esterase
MNVRRAVAAIVLLAAWTAQAQQPAWVGSWGASPLPPSPGGGPFPATPGFSDQTVRQVVRLSAGGERVRLRFTNEYGAKPVTIGAARVALAEGAEGVKAGSEHAVTFDGQAAAMIAANAPLLSDPIDLKVDDLAMLSVSVYFKGDTGPCTCHATGMQATFVSAPGDFTKGTFTPAQTLQQRVFLSGVEVLASNARAVVVLGDSISDGVGSTAGANRRWPDLLAERLNERGSGPRWGVVNQGISGNRVLSDGAGESALARFDRDVLSVPGVTHVIVFEGVNDLGVGYGRFEGPIAALFPPGPKPTREAMIAGYRQLIARAHSRGLKIYGATIAPYEGAAYYTPEGNAVRVEINDWIRTSREFDGVLDFDAVFRDPAKPTQMKEGLHSGDHLHGSDAGYRAVADSIDLKLFR